MGLAPSRESGRGRRRARSRPTVAKPRERWRAPPRRPRESRLSGALVDGRRPGVVEACSLDGERGKAAPATRQRPVSGGKREAGRTSEVAHRLCSRSKTPRQGSAASMRRRPLSRGRGRCGRSWRRGVNRVSTRGRVAARALDAASDGLHGRVRRRLARRKARCSGVERPKGARVVSRLHKLVRRIFPSAYEGSREANRASGRVARSGGPTPDEEEPIRAGQKGARFVART